MKPDLYDCRKCGTLYQTQGKADNCKHEAWIPHKIWGKQKIKFPILK